jgi:hypothetical protein
MFVFENYNLKPDYMYFLPSNIKGPDSTYLVVFGTICILFILAFYFRVSISETKEKLKKSIRAYVKPFFFKVRGDTLYTANEGPIQFIWEYLDDHFLTPSLPGSGYEHLYEINYDEEDAGDGDSQGEDDDDDDGEDDDGEEGEDDDNDEEDDVVKEGMNNKLEYAEIEDDETDSEDDE